MSAFRVTQRNLSLGTLTNLQGNLNRMQRLQEQLSSGKQVAKPSDSPPATVNAMRYRSETRRTEQFSRNALDGLSWLGMADETLTKALGQVSKARQLVLQGANATNDAGAGNALAAEAEGLREGLLQSANTKYLNRPIFAGTSGSAIAYDAAGVYQGDAGAVKRSAGPGVEVQVNVTGTDVFGSGPTGLFGILSDVATRLRGNDPVTGLPDPNAQDNLRAELTRLDAVFLKMQNAVSTVGARSNQVDALRNRADDQLVTLRNALSETEDIDLPKTIVDLQLQETAYQAALSASARVLQPSLVDFLR